ncbi:MAG: hypothetical protein WCP20_09525 [Desulfuromonadales bacterium]
MYFRQSINFSLAYNYTIATVLIVIYLTLPATKLTHDANLIKTTSGVLALSDMATSPCEQCPSSEGQSSGCCDSMFCKCMCHAPLGQGLRLTYAPVIAVRIFRESSCSLPQVYRPIFAPPQNST